MNFIDTIRNTFKAKTLKFTENLSKVQVTLSTDIATISKEPILHFIESLCIEDQFVISIEFEYDDVLILSKQTDIDKFIEEFKERKAIIGDDEFTLKIDIVKIINNNSISIYNFNEFVNWLNNLNLFEQLEAFAFVFKKNSNQTIVFRCYDVQAIYSTETIQFIPNTIIEYPMQLVDRLSRFDQLRQNTNFSKVNNITLIPEDFDLKNGNSGNTTLNNIFNKLKIILSFVYISDYADLDKNSLTIKMNGYRSINKIINLNSYEYMSNQEELFKIYDWIYSGGNSCDKIQLAKNIISLHCKYSDILDIDNKTFSSIKANYDLYLKASVDKYLETKKEYTTFLLDIIEKINNEVSSYYSSLKNNMVAILTYIIGIVVSNAFSDGKFNDIFTKDITIITSFIILGSLVFFGINIFETFRNYRRYTNRIVKIKESYGDILDDSELNEILNKTLDLEKTKTEFKSGIKVLSYSWVIMIIAMLSILDYLSTYKVLLIFNLFNK